MTALVTGAGSAEGIGFATARLLAEMGAQLAITATTSRILDRASELAIDGHDVHSYLCDLTDRAATRTLISQVMRDCGKIDILVNNAGMTQVGTTEDFVEFAVMEDAHWDTTIQRNLTTCYNVTRAVLPGMVSRRFGRIVNVSSTTGTTGSNAGEAAYSAAKAAMIGMSRGIALEVARHNITINNILPGWVATASQTDSERIASQHTPFGRAGTAREMASMIAYLSTPGASYITGQILVVDGGNGLQESKGP